MNRALSWTLLLLALLELLAIEPSSGAACGGHGPQPLRVRLHSVSSEQAADEDEEDEASQMPHIDLSQLSEKQLKQLLQQLNVAQAADAAAAEEESNFDEDHRGSSRPWNKVQRIIRRQLVRIPKRYLKKLLRQFGLARSSSAARRSGALQLPPQRDVQPQLYYLIPLE